MPKPTDIRPIGTTLYYLPIKTRVPLKFGPEITTECTLARVRLRVSDAQHRSAVGWGETPLSVQWVWPSALSYNVRNQALLKLTERLAALAWGSGLDVSGLPDGSSARLSLQRKRCRGSARCPQPGAWPRRRADSLAGRPGLFVRLRPGAA